MFCAAMMLACPAVEVSIYSTCKRISQKILRNVQKFALMIADGDYSHLNFTVKRENMEECNIQGPLGNQDVRIINSYPSKVMLHGLLCNSQLIKSQKSKVNTVYSLTYNRNRRQRRTRACVQTNVTDLLPRFVHTNKSQKPYFQKSFCCN